MSTLNKTIFPELVNTYIASTSALLYNYTNFLDINQEYIDQVQACINYELSDASGDFVTADSKFLTTLNYKLSTFDNEFIDYWVTQYNRCVSDIKNTVYSNIKGKNFFQQYSDSIGLFTNSIFSLDDTTLSLTSNIYPINCSTSVYSKLSKNSFALSQELSYKTTALYRKNISNISLVPDLSGFQRVQNSIAILARALNKNLDNIFNLVCYYCSINNQSGYNGNNADYNLQLIAPIDIQVNVEGVNVSVDLLGKKIKYLRDDKSINQILSYNTIPAIKNTSSINNTFTKYTLKNYT